MLAEILVPPSRLRACLTLVSAVVLLGSVGAAQDNVEHTANSVTVTAQGQTLEVDALRADVLRVRLFATGHPAEDASWAVLPAARVSKEKVTNEDKGFSTSLLRVAVSSDLKLTVTDLAGNIVQTDATAPSRSGASFRLHKAKTPSDHFFGLGDKPGQLDRLGQSFVMWNTDSFGWQESTDPIYKSVPFFLNVRDGGRTVGVLFDNTFRSFFDFGHELTNEYSFGAPDGPADYYILYGPEPRRVLEQYAWLTGPTPLPPLWVLGFQQSRYSYFPQSQVEEIAAHLRADHIPADAIYLDIDYQLKNRPFTVDTEHFPDFKGMVDKLAADHFHTIVITDLHIADLPNAGYVPYDTGKAGDNFVKRNGQDYVGPVWPGPSVFPDFTRQETRKWWGTLYSEFVKDGVAGFWNDMNEPAVFVYPTKTMPDDVQHRIAEPGFAPRTMTHLEAHNIYGMENSRATWDGLLALEPNKRPFVLTRASYAGGQRYAATWTGDNLATWNHLRQTTPQLLNLGLSGFSLSGADVGGFGGSPSPDLLTRWLQLAAFQPIDRDHAAKGTRPHEPWVDGPEHEAIRRRYIEERYKLMPYLYTAAEETSRNGVPIVRPLFVEFPHAAADGHPIDLDGGSEFMFGASILVAPSPLPDDVAPYEVHLPPAIWYDYWTGEKLDRRSAGGRRDLEIRDAALVLKPVMVNPKLDELPVYARAGSIIPMAPLTQNTEETPQGPLTVRVFAPLPGDRCEGSVYQDDGSSYDFRKGKYLRLAFTCSVTADGSTTIEVAKAEGGYKPWWKQVRFEVVGLTSSAPQASVGSQSHPMEKTALGWAYNVPYAGQPVSLSIK